MRNHDAPIIHAIRISNMTQQGIADAMANRGYPWHQSTIWKLLRGQRVLGFNEAIDLADIIGVHPLTGIALTTPAQYHAHNAMRRIAAEVARWQEETV